MTQLEQLHCLATLLYFYVKFEDRFPLLKIFKFTILDYTYNFERWKNTEAKVC